MKFYRFLYMVFAPVFRLFYRIKVTGVENIPVGACVVCANHTSMLDPIFAAIAAIVLVMIALMLMGY